ncbi:MAG: FecR domain-containing protein [Polyangiaceae bacterium]
MKDLERLGERVAREQEEKLRGCVEQRRAPRAAFLRAVKARRTRQTSRAPYVLAAAACGIVALAALWFVVHPSKSLVTAMHDRRGIPVGSALALTQAGGELTFSDGSRLGAAAPSQLKLRALRDDGAEVELVHGAIQVEVVHRRNTNWSLQTGPFTVHVTGTRFALEWDDKSGSLDVRMYDGEVAITGKSLERPLKVRAGEALHLDAEGTLSGPAPETSSSGAPRNATSDGSTQSEARPATSAPSAPATDRAPLVVAPPAAMEWREYARKGDYARAWDAVAQRGFETSYANATLADLVSLCDVAHFTTHAAEARRCFSAIRTRFAGRPEAATAAFQLGRLSTTQQEAARWFRTYLSEQPSGRLAREASGRLLEALAALGDSHAAHEQAERYLSLYPDGVHAQFARSLLGR